MKRSRGSIIAGVVVAGLVAFTVYDTQKAAKQEEKKSVEARVLRFAPAEIAKLEFGVGEKLITMELKGEDWQITSPIKDTADAATMMATLAALSIEKSSAVVAEGADLNLARFGLENSPYRMKATAKDGRVQEIRIGTESSFNSGLYARIDQEPKVLMVGNSWRYQVDKDVSQIRDKRLFRDQLKDEIERLEIREAGVDAAPEIGFEKGEKSWRMVKGGDGVKISEQAVVNYLDAIKHLKGNAILAEDQFSKGIAEKFGLATPTLEVRLVGKDPKNVFTLKAGVRGKDASSIAVAASDVPPVFSVEKSVYDSIRKTPEDFYDRKAPFQFKTSDVARIHINVGGTSAREYAKESGSWKLVSHPAPGGTANAARPGTTAAVTPAAANLDQLPQKVAALTALRFLPRSGPHGSPAKGESTLEFSKASGEKIFQMSWGAPVTEKQTAGQPETTFIVIRTSLLPREISVAEADIKSLGLESFTQTEKK